MAESDDLYNPHPGLPDGPLFPEGESGAWLLGQIREPDPEPGPPWVQGVRARFESAIVNGWSYTWDNPGVYTRPGLPSNARVETHADGTTSVAFDGGLL